MPTVQYISGTAFSISLSIIRRLANRQLSFVSPPRLIEKLIKSCAFTDFVWCLSEKLTVCSFEFELSEAWNCTVDFVGRFVFLVGNWPKNQYASPFVWAISISLMRGVLGVPEWVSGSSLRSRCSTFQKKVNGEAAPFQSTACCVFVLKQYI